MATHMVTQPIVVAADTDAVEDSTKRKLPSFPNSCKLIGSESDNLRLDGYQSMAYYGSNRRYSLGIFAWKSTKSGFSLVFFDSEEMREHYKYGGKGTSIKRWLHGMGSFKGTYKTGCILGEELYFVVEKDDCNVRCKVLEGKMKKPIKSPEPIGYVTSDSGGRRLFAVAKSGKVYMLNDNKSAWEYLMFMPKGTKANGTSFTLEDVIVENGKASKVLMKKWVAPEGYARKEFLCVLGPGNSIKESKEVYVEAAKFVPRTEGRVCCGMFNEDFPGDEDNFFAVYDLYENEFLARSEDAAFNYEDIEVSSVMVDENWKVNVRGSDYRVKSYDAYPTLYNNTLQLSCDDDETVKRVRGFGG